VVFNFGLGTNAARNAYDAEHDILSSLPPHPNVVRFWSQALDPIPDEIARELPSTVQTTYRLASGEQRRRKTQFVILDYHPFSLDAVVAALPHPLPMDRIVRWSADLVRALVELRSNGIIHRDLKLDNALVAEDGRLVLCDFGCALRLDLPRLEQEFHHGVSPGGNPAHIAPEVWNAVSRLAKARGQESAQLCWDEFYAASVDMGLPQGGI